MGIFAETAGWVKTLKLPEGFSVCELGAQMVAGKVAKPAEAFYRAIGCGRYVSIDGNGLGTVTHDLNEPVTALGLGTFDLVTDFGTGEHIFDQAQVWLTIHELCKPQGYLAFDRPTLGYGKHGFYLTEEGLFRDVAFANAYRIVHLGKQETPRGWLVRGVFQRMTDAPFRVPQQHRYRPTLKLPGGG